MGQKTRKRGVSRAFISIDGFLLTIAVAVMLFCIGAFIRISNETATVQQHGGLLTLEPGDELIAFEDFSFGAEEWSHPLTSDQLAGLGPVLGPFTDEDVSRQFHLSDDARNVRVILDVQLRGAWAERDFLRVTLNETDELNLIISGVSDDHVALDIATPGRSDMAVGVEQTRISPRAAGAAFPDAVDDVILSLRVTLWSSPVSEMLSLEISAEATSQDASWTLDNLAIVASTNDDAV